MANEFGSQDPFGLFGKSSKPQPAKQPATDPLESYIASAKAAESGGNPRAKNPNSSATGLYQFTGPTWAGLMQTHPELNLSADGRTDPAQQERAMRAFTADNAAVLKSKGIPVDGGSLYAAHFLGAGGASQVLTAPDNTPLSAVVDRKAMASNGFLSGMTVGDFKKWAAAKGSGGSAPISGAAPASSVQVDAGFKPSDPMGLYRGAQFSPEPQTTPAPAPADGPSPEQQRVQQLYQQLEQAQPGRYQLIYADQAQQMAADWQKANGSDGLLGDTWRLLGMGQVGLEASTRELVNQIPVIGPHLVAAGDQIDKWVYGKPSAERYADLYNRDAATLTPETQAARDRQWWDDKNGRLGDAWLDPRAYFSGAVESLPSMVATMAPGMWLAKGAFAGAIARGLSTEAASAAAARTALFSGAVLEGSLGGADAARATRAQIEAMPRDQLLQSDAVRALVSQGLSPDEAIKAIANDAATQAFIIGGIGTGIFGGFGDRALAKIIAEGVGGSLAKRIVSGALRDAFAEGVLEEAPQSALSQLGQNIAMRNVDPTQDLGAGVLDQTLGGAAIGGVMGAAMGGAGGAFRQAEEPSLAEPVQRPLPDSAMESAPQPTTAPATPSRGPLAGALAQGLAAAQTPSVDLSGEDLTPTPGETRVDAPGPDMPTMPAAYVGYPEPGKRVIVDEPTLGRFAARVEQYVDDPESGQLEAVVVDDSGEVMQVPATTLQVASLTKELMAKMDAADQPPVAQGPPVDAADEAKARVVNGKTLVMPDETLAKLYDLGAVRRQQKVLSGASGLQMRDLWSPDSQALADALGVLPERINEIADDYRYRVERVSKTAPDNRSSLMHGLNSQKLKAWRAERAAKPALDAAPADAPVEQADAPAPTAEDITAAANEAATSPTNALPEPTQAQKEAGNYKLGHVKLGGLDISIENPAGSERKGVDKGGKAWSVKMKAHYGYIKGTVGKDKDHVDIFVRKDAGDIADADPVFVIDQVNAEGGFDEHKVMLGYKEAAQAKRGYLANYTKGWAGLGAITETTLGAFKQWLTSGNTAKPFGKIAESAKNRQTAEKAPEAAPAPEAEAPTPTETSSASDVPDVEPGNGAASQPPASAPPAKPKRTKPDATAAARELLGNWTAGPIQSVGIGKELQGGTVFEVTGIAPNGTVTLQARGAVPMKLTLKELRAEVAAGLSFTAEPATPAKAPKPQAADTSWAEELAKDVAGRVVFAEGDIALIEGHSVITGEPVYAGAKRGRGRTRVDVDGYTGSDFTPDELRRLKVAKTSVLSKDARLLGEHPNGPFRDGSVAASASISPEIVAVARDLLDLLGIKARVFLSDPRDMQEGDAITRYRLFGPYAAIRSGALKADGGSARRLASGDYNIVLAPRARKSALIETLAHEIGHIVDRELLQNAEQSVQNALLEAHKAWLDQRKALPAEDYVRQLRAYVTGRLTDVTTDDVAAQLPPYWRSFSEWFADNVAKWATTDEVPNSVVARFFAKIAAAYRRMLERLGAKGLLPDQSVSEFLNARISEAAPAAKQSLPAPQADAQNDRFAKNKLFTADKVEAARARLRGKMGQLNSGIDPEVLIDGMTIAGAYIEAGVRNFADYAKAMVGDFGDGIAPYLLSFWEGARNYPGLDTEGMTNHVDSAAAFAAMIAAKPDAAPAEKADEPRKLDQRSQGALEGAPADEVSVAPEGGDAEAGAAGRGGADVSRGEPARGERVPAGRGVADGAGTVSDPAGRGQQPGAGAAKSDARGAGSSGTRSADDDDRVAAAAVDSAATPAQALPNDFTITDEDAIGAGGAKTKFRANVAAIKLLRELDAANRPATRQEQAVLAKWVGWGGLSAAFPREDGSLPKGWDKEAAELTELLTPEEYRAAEASTRNAHYTSPEVVRAIWSIVQRAGFAGGRVLEPSVGAGNFLGLIPADLRDSVQVTGVELDRITGGVAKHLYPKATIHTPVGFQDVQIPDGYFDLAIGNPPFGSEKLYDPNRRDISKFSIHNFFFAKSLDALRPGGLLAMVVSNGLMDANSTEARRYMAARADLVGAIRLPNDAFLKNAGTEVTTDILVFQRRDGVDDTASPDWVAGPAQLAWKDAKGKEVALNPYFQRRPEMMLGDFGAYGTMYRANSAALVARPGQNLADELERAIGRLPAGIVKTGADPAPETITVANGVDSAIVGSMFLSDGGAVHMRRPDVVMQRVSKPIEFPNDRAKERVTGMIRVRDAFARLRHAQINPAATDDAVERLRARLNKIYDTFVAANGPINQDANKRLFRDDPTWPQIAALEDGFDKGLSEALAKKTGETPRPPSARKAKIFTLRTQQPYSPPTSAATAKDALAAVLSERGRVDVDAMAVLYGKSPEETIAELGGLIFRTPGGAYETADAYLSGNVKKKLALAREAAQKDRAFERNVSALEGVIPADVEAVDIDVKPGVGWVPAKYVGQFIEHLTEGRGAKAVYSVGTAQWIIDPPQHTAAAEAQWATERVSLKGVIEAVLAGRAIQVFDQLGEGKLALNQAATDAANEKAARVAAEWRRWLWQDDERRETLSRLYNDTFNTDAPRAYDGMHLQLPGKVGDDIIELRPHQKSFIWRAMQTSTALADHAVGAGKTFALIATAMEFRRTGLAKKPMFVVPNHLVGQWAADFVKLYPGARVLAATKADFEKGKRQELFSRVATGDWDAVIVSHSSFGKVPVDPEFETRFINQQIADLEQSVRELQSEGEGRSRTVKQLAKQREALETRFKKLMDSGRKDLGMTFEEMGVDALFVDEAHEFKNLGFATRMTRIAGLGNSQGSAKAADLYTKVQSVLERTGGRNIVFATGTPISNTMAELFTVQRYLDYPALKAAGIAHFDAWARVFGEVVTDWELSPSGTYKLTSRFAKFVNMPELMQRYRAFADVITNDDIKRQLAAQGKTLPLPKVKDGKPSIVVVERNAAQARFIGEPALDERGNEQYPKGTLVWRAENLPKKQEPGADNMLKVMSDARKAALDMRLIDPGLPDFRGSKVHVAADNIKRIYKRWNADKGTQLVFIDLSTPKAARGKEAERIADLLKKAEEGDEDAAEALEKLSPDELLAVESSFSVYDDLKQKLIDRGIPSDEIAFIHDANTDAQKEELFGKVRTGRVRVLFGSTPKMGAGTNVQNRLVALHHLDAPWRPSDLEQRDGRGIRQGNELYEADPEGFELEILRYATKNTLDARQWQTIEGKARFIAQVRKGGTEREVEDVAGEAANAAEMKAAASGNPLVLEEMDLRRKLRKLDGARSEHEREQFRIRGTMSRLRAGIDKAAAMLSSLEKDAASAGAIIDAGFPHTVAGQTIEKATQLGDLVIAKAKEAFLAGAELPFGKFGDFALSAQPVPRVGAEQAVRITMTGAMDHSFTLETPVDANATGVGTVMLNVLRSLRKEPERVRGNIEADTAQLPKLEAQVQPWSGARELEDTKAAHATVLAKLKPKPSANTAAPSGAQPSANPDAVISLTGSELGIAFNGASDMPALRSAAKTWYDQHLRNTTATMADGTVVRFSRKGMGKSTSDAKGDLLLRSVPAIRAIIEGGRVVLREPGSRPGIVERIVIAAPVDFAGRRLNLAVSVHRSANGDVHYDLNMDRDAKDGTPGVSPGGAAPDGALPSLEMPRPAEINLMQWSELNNAPVGWDEVSAGGPVALSQEDRAALAEIVRTVAGLSEVQWHDRISLPNGAPGWGKNTPTTAAGYYDPVRDLIGLADDTASDRTAFHEAFHRLQNLFLSDEERATLRADLPKLRRIVKANEFRSEQAGAMSPKEVEAEAFALYATGLAKAKPHTLVRAAWERIIAAVRRVINWAGGRGFQISEDVFERAMRGEVAARDAGGVSTLLRAYAVNPDAPYVVKPSTVDQQLPRREGPRLGRPARVTQETIVRQIKGKLVDLQPALLKVIPLNYFTELAQPNMSAVQSYLGIKRQMDAYRGRKHAAADEIAQEWLKFSRLGWGLLPSKDGKAASARLSSLMHDSTLAGIDPSSTLDEHRLKPGYDDLRRRYLELPPTGRELFTKVRDAYVAQADELDKLLLDAVYKAQKIARNKAQERYEAEIDRINSSDLEGEALRKAVEDASAAHARDMLRSQYAAKGRLSQMRRQFEQSRVPAPYFPLMRYGRYFVSVKNARGEVVSFSRREKAADRDALAKQMRSEMPQGFKVEVGVLDGSAAGLREYMDPRLLADIEAILGGAGVDGKVMDAIYQRYLETMPDLSARKRFIHRKGTRGYDEDALRAFSSHMFHAAHQMGRIKYGLDLQEMTDQATIQARTAPDPTAGMTLANQLKQHHQWVMNPTGSAVAQVMTSAAFTWYLAGSPAAALVNLTQTPMLGIPILGARFGTAKSADALLKASADVVRGKGDIAAKLNAEERAVMERFYESGLIDRTQAHDLAGVGETGVNYSPLRARVMGVMSWAFHKAEVVNRQVTALAAYRLARAAGRTAEEAVNLAHDLTWKVHFDYSNASRPAVLQNDIAKVALVFRNHTINMLYRMFRDMHQAVKGATPQARKEARYQLAAVIGMQALVGGLKGVFAFNLLMALAGLAFGNDDDPLDFKAQMEKHVMDALGPELGGILLNGAPGHYLKVDLTDRVGMPDLWWRSPPQDLQGRDEFQYYVMSSLGASVSLLGDLKFAVDLAAEGNVGRALEVAAPKWAKDLLKSARYMGSGVTTLNGDTLLERTEIDPWTGIAQALGFTPAKIAETYERNNALKNAEQRVLDERRELINRYVTAILQDDEGAAKATAARISTFNGSGYGRTIPITSDTIRRSMKTRRSNDEKRVDGVLISNEKLGATLRAAMAPAVYR